VADKKGSAKPAPVVKKVVPYPFAATVETNGVKLNVQVIFLNARGFIAKTGGQFVHVGSHCQASFELPVLHNVLMTPVRVLKTYDKALDPKVATVDRLAEFHFEKLSEEQKNHVISFTTAIGQAK
jgi:hypothetical protein